MNAKHSRECFTQGLDALVDNCLRFVYPKLNNEEASSDEETNSDEETSTVKTPNTAKSDASDKFFSLQYKPEKHNPSFNLENQRLLKVKEIQDEVKLFTKTIIEVTTDYAKKKKHFSNQDFWLKYTQQFPNLTKLANILLNVPCSSAFIERFFSICGVICKQRASNMKDDLIITRAMLKSNMKILKEMNQPDDE